MSSGPGAMSQRTDGGPASKQAARYMAGGDYGDGTDMMNIQQGAPMAATPTIGATGGAAAQQPIPINAPSQRPGEPVTTGAPIGAGAGTEALNLPQQQEANGLQNALILLNQLGDNASTQVKSIRNALAAHLNNQNGNK